MIFQINQNKLTDEVKKLTIDMSPNEYMCLKIASAQLGMSMRDLLLQSTFRRIEEIEDEWLAKKAKETLKNIESGKERTISLEEMKRRCE